MALQIWETLKEAITAYTGLAPPTFFTVVAVGLLTYYLLSTFQTSSSSSSSSSSSYSESDVEPLPPPVQVGEITEEELRLYDGSDPKKPLLMAIKAQIYDVSQSRGFYGPGGPYALFAGRDASRALAKMSFEEKDLTSDVTGLGIFELEALQTWEYKFMSKYVKVGTVKTTVPESEETPNGEPSQSAAAEMSNLTKSVEVSPSAVEAAEPEGGLPVKGDPENTNGDKDQTGSNSITGAVKTE